MVDNFLGRPLDAAPIPTCGWRVDPEGQGGGQIVNVSVVATGVDGAGQREVLGMDVGAGEDGAFWLAFLRSLNARGLSGVEVVVSDAHQGLKNAIATAFAQAGWQRRRTHLMANLLSSVPKGSQPSVATMVRTIYKQLSPEEFHHQAHRVVAQLREHFPQAADLQEDALPDILAFTAFPVSHLAEALVQQPTGTIEPGDPPARQRGGHLPQPGRHPASGGRGAGRTA